MGTPNEDTRMDRERMPGSEPTKRRRSAIAHTPYVRIAASILAAAFIAGLLPAAASDPDRGVRVIVRGAPGSLDQAENLVLDAGGRLGRRISIIDGFTATVPAVDIAGLVGSPEILSVTADATVRLLSNVDGIDPNKDPGSWLKLARNTKLYEMWQRGWTGDGID